MKALTALQKRYCDIILLMELAGKVNQQKAYELAGYKCRGKTAKTEASRTLSKPSLKKYLARARIRRVAEKNQEKTRAEIVREYEIMAFARAADYYNEDGNPKQLKDLTEEQKSALRSITIEEHHYTNKKGKPGKIVTTKYDIHPKKSSLDSLAKIKGLMKGDVEEAAKTFAQALHEAMKDEE